MRTGVDEAWALAYGAIHGGGPVQEARTAAYGRMLAALGDRALAATVDDGGLTVGLGFGVVTDQAAGYETRADEAAAAMDRFLAALEARRTSS